ncbi:hypothetical protein T265_04429 [Opisthorchis viverrini]|uniref:Uncharacterized protein n=1 Tax=Opisthorchis viverrini TaxID=6198 RepID=A0A074ZNY3_OPIVI|nr:hypothetical protein T265_04429 [Opisthorchis viverrini]KER28821.1 hypothetical protein T265_04429 [Opisthorchis viverrini]
MSVVMDISADKSPAHRSWSVEFEGNTNMVHRIIALTGDDKNSQITLSPNSIAHKKRLRSSLTPGAGYAVVNYDKRHKRATPVSKCRTIGKPNIWERNNEFVDN